MEPLEIWIETFDIFLTHPLNSKKLIPTLPSRFLTVIPLHVNLNRFEDGSEGHLCCSLVDILEQNEIRVVAEVVENELDRVETDRTSVEEMGQDRVLLTGDFRGHDLVDVGSQFADEKLA